MIFKKIREWIKAVILGPDMYKLAGDLGREFGKPHFDDGVVEVYASSRNTLTMIIGKHRSVTFKGRTFEIIGTGTDDQKTDFGSNDVESYEMVFKRYHLPVIIEEMKRMIDREGVKNAHPDTWYRFTLWTKKEGDVTVTGE